jgi:virginiamycin B lyase
MNTARRTMKKRYTGAIVLTIVFAAACLYNWPAGNAADEPSLLGGKVTSSTGEALGGVPVRAHRDNSTMTVSVYTNRQGEYSYPGWSDVKPGAYTVAIELPDFEPVKREGIALSAGKTAKLDFSLKSRTPSVKDATASEIVAALPGTDEQKHLLIQCDNCHSLQHAFRVPRDKEGWMGIIKRMAGERAITRETPNTRAFGQKQYVEPLAEYLAQVRGPGSSDAIPFKLRTRPTSDASTRVVITEYDIPRAGNREENIIRGDRRAVWPHDIVVEPSGQYAYYTDHFSYAMGRLDLRTGEAKEFPYPLLPGMGRAEGGMIAQAQLRAGNPGGGAHDMQFDPQGNVVFGMGGGTMRFNTKTQEFTPFASGSNMFGQDGAGNIWYLEEGFHKLDPKTGEVKKINIPEDVEGATYDMETDKQGRSFMNMFRESRIGMYDPATDKFESFPTPTHGAGPRRGDMDAQGRPWMGLYWAGRVGMFDPKTRQVKEFSLRPDHKPFGPPFISPYSVAVDDKNQFVWANDFNSDRIYRVNIRTGESTEIMTPSRYEIRDLTADESAPRPTVWIPAYRPPSKMVKIQTY